MSSTYKILSIRGGGIRGIIPCCCLMKLEAQLGGLTRDHIDFCAGTSTGALLTAAVAAGVPASRLLQVYTNRSHEIFTPSGPLAEAKRIAAGFMYDPQRLHNVLVNVFGPSASWTINDCPIRVMISATAMNGHNWFFVKDNARNNQTTGAVPLVDAAVASACAPTYFNHWRIGGIMGQTICFFDGGAGGTANPVYQACVEAFEYDGFQPADTRVVALGTGYFPASGDPPKGLLQTIGWTASTLSGQLRGLGRRSGEPPMARNHAGLQPAVAGRYRRSRFIRHPRFGRDRPEDGGRYGLGQDPGLVSAAQGERRSPLEFGHLPKRGMEGGL